MLHEIFHTQDNGFELLRLITYDRVFDNDGLTKNYYTEICI